MTLAENIAFAMLQARSNLPADLQDALTPNTARTFGQVVVGIAYDEKASPELANFLTKYRDAIAYFVAQAARDSGQMDYTIGAFLGLAKVAGADLRDVLNSAGFAQLDSRLSTPCGFFPSPKPTESRARQYLSFENKPGSSATNQAQIDFWRRELQRADIAPDLRWYYEKNMLQAGLDSYKTAEEAAAVWRSVLAGQLSPDLRAYYRDRLAALSPEGIEV